MASPRDILATARAVWARRKGLLGRVERVEGGRIVGWAMDRRRPDTPLRLQLVVDGRVHKTFTATLPRNDVAAAGLPRRDCGFELAIPADVTGRIRICFEDGSPLPGMGGVGAPAPVPDRLRAVGAQGMVERIGPADVMGWAADPADLSRLVDVCILVDGDPAMIVVADRPRSDVARSGRAGPNCGFQVPLPRHALDGRPHRIQVVINDTGIPLPGGEGVIESKVEGVVFYHPETLSLAGWVRPADVVSVRFDDENAETHVAALPVPGLGTLQGGFEIAIPPAFMDGAWHTAHITHPVSRIPLDGSPVSFRIKDQARVLLRDAHMVGRRFEARLTDYTGAPLQPQVRVTIDDRTLPVLSSHDEGDHDIRAFNIVSFPVPPGAHRIAVRGAEDGALFGEWTLEADGLRRIDTATHTVDAEISARTLADPALLQGARDRFAAFVDLQGPTSPLFDARWYGVTYLDRDDVDGTEALTHYATTGAMTGHSPSPDFDEEGQRQRHPALADAIAAGHLPCAFALHLHLAQDTVLDPVPAAETPRPPHIPRSEGALPPPTWQIPAVDSVYQAWMLRLNIDDATAATLRADEDAARAWLGKTHMDRRPLVSIIMPTYNRAHTIADAIQSALDQTYDNFELLICDDASIDKTAEVVSQFDDPRVRYMPFAKSNGAGTRNKGLRFAEGEVIAYLDSDNLWHPLFLDMMVRKLADNPGRSIAYSAYLDTETVGARVELAALSRPYFRPVGLSSRNFMDLNTIVHLRHVYDWLGGFDPDLPRLQDWDLMLRYTSVFQPLAVDHALVYYRRNVAWGQVTHLFLNSGAQDSVNLKTQARLNDGHVRLARDPAPRVHMTLVARGAIPTAMAVDLARRMGRDADVTLWTDGAQPADVAGVRHGGADLSTGNLPAWAYALDADSADGTVALIGFGEPDVTALRAALPSATLFTLRTAGDGLSMVRADDARQCHHLGTLQLGTADLRAGDPAPLLMIPPRQGLEAALARAAKDYALPILVPPENLSGGDWALYPAEGGRPHRLREGDGLRLALAASRAVAVSTPVDGLDPATFALVVQVAGQGRATAMVSGPMADDWLDARCAFRITKPDARWIVEKMAKLLDSPEHDRFAAAAGKAWRISLHPQLTQERARVFAHTLAQGPALPEVRHDAP